MCTHRHPLRILLFGVLLALLVGVTSAYAAAPPNDNFSSAQVLTGLSGSVTSQPNLAEATVESGEPDHCSITGMGTGRSVWYAWTAPATGWWSFTVTGADVPKVLAIYTGTDLTLLTQLYTAVSYVPDVGLTVHCEAGTTLRMAVAYPGGVTPAGSFQFSWQVYGFNSTLTGTVTDAISASPLSDVTVDAGALGKCVTGANGTYTFVGVPPGTYTLSTSKQNYLPQSATGVAAAEGATTVQDFALQPAPAPWIDISPLYAGQVVPGGSDVTFSWTSGGLSPGLALELWCQEWYLANGAPTSWSWRITGGLPQSGSYTVTIPAHEGRQYRYYLLSEDHFVTSPLSVIVAGPEQTDPAEDIDDVIADFDAAVTAGTLTGTGPGNSASGKLGALRNMLAAAETSITAGDYSGALAQLRELYKRCDGLTPPPDFVTGPAREALAAEVLALISKLEGMLP